MQSEPHSIWANAAVRSAVHRYRGIWSALDVAGVNAGITPYHLARRYVPEISSALNIAQGPRPNCPTDAAVRQKSSLIVLCRIYVRAARGAAPWDHDPGGVHPDDYPVFSGREIRVVRQGNVSSR